MKCLLCLAPAPTTPLCSSDWGRWTISPEARRAEAIMKSGDALTGKRVQVALMDFVRRIQAESQSAR